MVPRLLDDRSAGRRAGPGPGRGPTLVDLGPPEQNQHGGIGYSWEHDAHLFYERAKSAQLLLGPPSSHRARLADRLGV